jgi:acyl-coenzyme A thioesterase 13
MDAGIHAINDGNFFGTTMNELRAREIFEQALATHTPDFGTFFLARLFGLVVTYRDAADGLVADDAGPADVARIEAARVDMSVEDFMFNPQGGLHGGVTAR